MNDKKLAIGLMTGTSLDGLDLVLIEISGINDATKYKVIKGSGYEYPDNLVTKIKKTFNDKITSRFISSLNFEIAIFYANSINNFLQENNFKNKDISFIGSHGQTIYHLINSNKNEISSTLQLGDGSVISNLTGIVTVSDFRTADMALGGQGAPLVPFVNYVLYKSDNNNVVRLFQNIGGISNVSVIGTNINNIIGFDIGPGNMVIDEICQKLFNKKFDNNGELASKGIINKTLLKKLSKDSYLNVKSPKSTGREKYGIKFVEQIIEENKNIFDLDLLSTLTYFTAYCIVDSFKKFIYDSNMKYEMYITGGGWKNKTLVKYIEELSKDSILIKDPKDLNIDTDYKESIAFAILDNQTIYGYTSNVPSATQSKKYAILGKICR